jgi:hypothetical protein
MLVEDWRELDRRSVPERRSEASKHRGVRRGTPVRHCPGWSRSWRPTALGLPRSPVNQRSILFQFAGRPTVCRQKFGLKPEVEHEPPTPCTAIKQNRQQRARKGCQNKRRPPGDRSRRTCYDRRQHEPENTYRVVENPRTEEKAFTSVEARSAVGATSTYMEGSFRKQSAVSAIWTPIGQSPREDLRARHLHPALKRPTAARQPFWRSQLNQQCFFSRVFPDLGSDQTRTSSR